MTKFLDYITERVSAETQLKFDEQDIKKHAIIKKMIPKIKAEAGPYLKAVKSCRPRALYRGVTGARNIVIKKNIRTDRQPLMSKMKSQKRFDKYFLKHWGWKPRSEGMFSTGDIDMTTGYGDNNYVVFPTGPIKYLWSDSVADLFTYWDVEDEDLENIIKDVYTNKELCRALKDDGEIMIKAKSYYGIKTNDLVNFLKTDKHPEADGLDHYQSSVEDAVEIFIEDYLL